LFIKYLVSFSNKNHSCLKVDQIPTPKSVVHRFWDCPKAKAAAWEWAFTIIHSVSDPPQRRRRKKAFDVKQCLFTKKLLKVYRQFSCIWMLVTGLVLWVIWLDRNDKIFNMLSTE
jgi:cytochrome b subunit of formate dehydrogenase